MFGAFRRISDCYLKVCSLCLFGKAKTEVMDLLLRQAAVWLCQTPELLSLPQLSYRAGVRFV